MTREEAKFVTAGKGREEQEEAGAIRMDRAAAGLEEGGREKEVCGEEAGNRKGDGVDAEGTEGRKEGRQEEG